MSTVFLILFGGSCFGLGKYLGFKAGSHGILQHIHHNHPAVSRLLIASIDAKANGQTIELRRGEQ